MSNRLRTLRGFAARSSDSKDEAFNKFLILVIASCCSFCGFIWSAIYYSAFGFGLTMLLPLSFTVIVGTTIFISHRLKNHLPLVYVQLACITWISAFIQWSIGSMENSGIVISWSFLGPLGALIFLSYRQSLAWMGMFLLIVVVSAAFQPSFHGTPLEVGSGFKTVFYIMNLGTSSVVVFIAAAWFVKTLRFEKLRVDSLLAKIQALFGQHVSTEVAEELLAKEKDETDAKYYEVTVMFLDIRDFTKFADSREPHEVAHFQNTVFSKLIEIVKLHQGIVLQVLGDGIMAVFGAPVTNENHSSEAVKTGFEIIERCKFLCSQGVLPDIKLGIGLHSGRVIAGEVGNRDRKFYSLAGSNVIVAARIEQLNKELNSQFLISESTYKGSSILGYEYSFKGKVPLKGISEDVGIYQLI